MKKRNFIAAVFGTLMLLAAMSSCTKEGPMGPAGEDGNANVNDTILFNVSNDTVLTWTHDGGASDPAFYFLFNCSIITQDIFEHGVVQVFARPSGTTAWSSLPYSYPNGSGTYLGFSYGAGAVSVFAQTPPQVYDIKVVAIASN